MIEQGLFQKHIVGRDGFIWWIGQVASDSWKMNIPGAQPGTQNLSEQEGYGYRYQVRIMGYHTADCAALSNDELPWAGVMYPVTAGANAGSAGATPNIRKGNFVYGFFLDGEDAQQPIIMGIVGYGQYTPIYKNKDECMPFVPFLGYSKVPSSSVWTEREPIYDYAPGAYPFKTSINFLDQGGTAAIGNAFKGKSLNLGIKYEFLPEIKEEGGIKGVQSEVKKLIQKTENARASLKSWRKNLLYPSWSKINGQQVSINDYINSQLIIAAKKVSAVIAEQMRAVQKWIVKKIESALLKVYQFLTPPEQQKVGDATRTAMDILSCHYKRIINNLFKLVYKALTEIIDNYINIPLCAAENIISAIVGKLMGLVNGITNAVMGPINAILNALDQGLSIVGDALKFLEDVLSFLLCEDEPAAPEVKEWSTWLGSKPDMTKIDARNIIDKITNFAGGISDVVDPDNFNFDVGLDFSDILDDALTGCYTGPEECGPPRPVFWGGSGSGASGNAIISAAGDILGVEIINSGFGYLDKEPFLTFEDNCGKGYGGSGVVVTGPVSEGDSGEWFSDPDGTEIGVVGVNISDPGFGYIALPDGSQGGDGRVWAEYDQTTVQRDGKWDTPYDGGDLIDGYKGDKIRIPVGCKTQFLATNGETYEIFGGSVFTVPHEGVLTAPSGCADTSASGDYPVILYICDIQIIDPGFGYQEGDKVVVTPDVGAEIIPTFGPFGNLVKVELINGGEGFTEFPTITIESETGFNAEIRARLCIDRITDELKIPEVQDKIVSVVDCVGTV